MVVMEDIGLVALLLLFGVGFTFYIGGPSICAWNGGTAAECSGYVPGFIIFMNALATGNISALINTYLLIPLTGIVTVASIGIAALAGYVNGESIRVQIAIVVLIPLANLLFIPFGFLNSAIFTYQPLGLFIVGFFNLLLLLALIGFVMDKRF